MVFRTVNIHSISCCLCRRLFPFNVDNNEILMAANAHVLLSLHRLTLLRVNICLTASTHSSILSELFSPTFFTFVSPPFCSLHKAQMTRFFVAVALSMRELLLFALFFSSHALSLSFSVAVSLSISPSTFLLHTNCERSIHHNGSGRANSSLSLSLPSLLYKPYQLYDATSVFIEFFFVKQF